MKYVRTKDGYIFEIEKNLGKYGTSKAILICDMQGNMIDLREQNNILKQANTIEELCDEFVLGNKVYNKANLDFKNKIINLGHKNWQKFCNFQIIYGAIWTDKGLIYVAKIEKGELELI